MYCSGDKPWHCCSPKVPREENIVGLEDNCSDSTCEEEEVADRLKGFLPFTVLSDHWKKQENDNSDRSRRSSSDQPLMFMPGRILYLLEETKQQTTS